MNFIFIISLGACGVASRVGINKLCENHQLLNATLISNIIGCTLIGVIYYFYSKSPSSLLFALMVGFCGGLTTFSSFSLDYLKTFQSNIHFKDVLMLGMTPFLMILVSYIGFKVISLMLS